MSGAFFTTICNNPLLESQAFVPSLRIAEAHRFQSILRRGEKRTTTCRAQVILLPVQSYPVSKNSKAPYLDPEHARNLNRRSNAEGTDLLKEYVHGARPATFNEEGKHAIIGIAFSPPSFTRQLFTWRSLGEVRGYLAQTRLVRAFSAETKSQMRLPSELNTNLH